MSDGQWDEVLAINLTGTIFIAPSRRVANDRSKLWAHREHRISLRAG